MRLIPIVFNMCACSDGILLSNSDLLFAKTPGWEKMDPCFRGNDNVAQELITTGIKVCRSDSVNCPFKTFFKKNLSLSTFRA